MKKLVLFLFLSSCAIDPMFRQRSCDWRLILEDPLMNQLMDKSSVPSSSVASVYVEFRGLQLRQQLLQRHLCDQKELIALTSDLVDSGVASLIDLQALISFNASLQAEQSKLQTSLDKLLYQLAPLVKENPWCLADRLCLKR